MYQFDSRVRYSEVDENGLLSLTGIMDYLQDSTMFQTEMCGCGMDWLKQKDRMWVLSGWQIDIFRRPGYLETIRVITMPYAFEGMLGYRCFEIRSESGELLVFANSVWCYLQTSAMRPVKLTSEDIELYGELDPAPARKAERKIRIRIAGEPQEAFVVHRGHLDTNHHVNNVQYVVMAMEYLAQPSGVHTLQVEYRSQAHLGDRIVPLVSCEGEETTVSLTDGDKKVYAVVRFVGGNGI